MLNIITGTSFIFYGKKLIIKYEDDKFTEIDCSIYNIDTDCLIIELNAIVE